MDFGIAAAKQVTASGSLLSIDDAAAAQHRQQALDAERVRLLYEGSLPNLLQFLGVAYVTALIVANELPAQLAMGWAAGMTLLFSARIAISLAFERAGTADQYARANLWEWRYSGGAFLAGAGWAALYGYVAFLGLGLSPLMAMALTLITAGILLTSIAALGTSVRAFMALGVPMLTAQILTLLFVRHYSALLAIGLAALYVIGIARAYVGFQRSLRRHISDALVHKQAVADQEALFSNTLVGIAHVKNRFILRANPQFFSLFGYAPDELLGQSIHRLFAFDAQKRTQDAIIADALEAGTSFTHEEGLRHKTGDIVWCTLQGRRYDPNDAREGAILVVADVTQMKAAEEALKQREAVYRTLVETTPSLIWSLDLKGNVTFANERGAQAVFGLGAAQLIGKNWGDLLSPVNRKRDWEALKGFLDGRAIIDYETTAIRADGREIEVLVNGTVLRARDGSVNGASGSLIDITARKQREDALRDVNRNILSAREALLAAIDAMPDSFALWDKDDRLELCNRRFAESFDPAGNPLRVVGRTYEELMREISPDDMSMPLTGGQTYEGLIAEMVTRHQAANGIPRLENRRDGRVVRIVERRLPDGGIVGMATDVSALYRSDRVIDLRTKTAPIKPRG
jgi:PAS domain S-box-containing protein